MACISRKIEKRPKRKRQPKATQFQIDYMVNYFMKYPHLVSKKAHIFQDYEDLEGSWEELVAQLNRLGERGKTKDITSWKATWRDNKTAVSTKVGRMRATKSDMEDFEYPELTEREEKILRLISVNHFDSENQLEELERRNEECDEICQEEVVTVINRNAYENQPYHDAESSPLLDDSSENAYELSAANSNVEELTSESTVIKMEPVAQAETMDCDIASKILVIDSFIANPAESVDSVPNERAESVTRPTNSSRSESSSKATTSKTSSRFDAFRWKNPYRRDRTTARLVKAGESNAELAARQVTCMEMFAKSMQQIAAAEHERNKILKSLIESDRRREETFKQLMEFVEETVKILKKD